MKCKEIIEMLETIAPLEYAEDWDNVGLLVGEEEKEIKKVMIAVDATDKIIKEACEKKVDMLITHHPLIFSGMKKILQKDFIGRRVRTLIKADISYCAMHTNFDIAGDMAGLALKKMNIKLIKSEVLKVTKEEKGIGRIGELANEMTLLEIAEQIKKSFDLETVQIYGEKEKRIKKIAVVPGSGKGEIPFAIAKEADVFLTGDIDHHHGIDAVSQNLAIIDAGHYGLEKIFINFIAGYLKQQRKELEIIKEKTENPFWNI